VQGSGEELAWGEQGGDRSQLRGAAGLGGRTSLQKPVVKGEGSNLNVVLSLPGMLVVIVLLLIAIAVVAVWPTH